MGIKPSPSRKDHKGQRNIHRYRSTPDDVQVATIYGWIAGTCTREQYDLQHLEHCPCCQESKFVAREHRFTVVDEHLLRVRCWCQTEEVMVPANFITHGLTKSCGRDGCQEPPRKIPAG